MTDKEFAEKIVSLTGGKENIVKAVNCMTRCRMTLRSVDKVKVEELKSTEGVLGYVADGNAVQIILGPGKAKKVTDEVKAIVGPMAEEEEGSQESGVSEDWQKNKDAIKAGQKQSRFKKAIRVIAEIFIPLIPAIIAAGLFNGFGSLISTLQEQGVLASKGFWEMLRLLFTLIGGAFLSYFAIFAGINAAKQFGATEALGGMIGAISVGSNIIEMSTMMGLFDSNEPLNSILTTGKGGLIGVILGVWVLSKIEKFIRKKIPDVLDLVVTPFLTLLISAIMFVFLIMPLAGFASDGLVSVLSIIINSPYRIVSIISGFILAALFLPMVLLGLHHGLIPIYAIQLEMMGGVSLFPVLATAGAGQVGAAIAIYIVAKKVKNERLQKVIAGALPAGFLGVGEPLIYGVTLPMFKPFITAGIGAGFGGAYVMMTHVLANAWGPSGLVALPIMKPECMLNYFIGLVIALAGGFLVTKFFIKESDVAAV